MTFAPPTNSQHQQAVVGVADINAPDGNNMISFALYLYAVNIIFIDLYL